MNLICGALKNLWLEFYNEYIRNVDDKTKAMIGGACILASMFMFILCTKGGSKTEMVNSWFLFWISMLLFIAGIAYLFFL